MGSPKSSFQAKVEWLISHHRDWLGWPERARLTDDQLKRLMVADGLISPKSHNYDIMDFGRLIGEARRQMKLLYGKMGKHL